MKTAAAAASALLLAGLAPAALAAGDSLAVLRTGSGELVIEFFPGDAPAHVENFASLAEAGAYDGTLFHRVIDGFMIQGGDPTTGPAGRGDPGEWGRGGPGYSIDAEFSDIAHDRGIVSMARSASPDSAGSQFFIVHEDSGFLDGQYTAFGRLATQESFETLDRIAALETPQSAGAAPPGAPGAAVPADLAAAEVLSAEIVARGSVPGLLEQGDPRRAPGVAAGPPGGAPSPWEGGRYTDGARGLSFEPPQGWLLQEPEKTSPDVPDVVAVGPPEGGYSPAIAVTVVPRGGQDLAGMLDERRESLEEAVSAGLLEITSEEITTVNGLEASVQEAAGAFALAGAPANVTFREIILAGADNFYVLTYSNEESAFEGGLGDFGSTVSSLEVADAAAPPAQAQAAPQGGADLLPAALAAAGAAAAAAGAVAWRRRSGRAAAAPEAAPGGAQAASFYECPECHGTDVDVGPDGAAACASCGFSR